MPEYNIIYVKKIKADREDAVYLAKLLQPENTELFQIVEVESKKLLEIED